MSFVLVGVSHKTCPLAIREKFFLQPTERDLFFAELRNDPRVSAAFILSTCNRTEIYVDLLTGEPSFVLERLLSVKHLTLSSDLEKFFYIVRDKEAVVHLLRVASGIDSLILGETQIQGQVKEALGFAREKRMLNRSFNILSHIVVETGKKIRRETHIDAGGQSISWAAVVKAQEIMGSLAGKSILIMGSGKMGRLAARQLTKKGAAKVYVMNRTSDGAEGLAQECHGTAVPFWQIQEILEKVDVCICATGAPHYVIDKELALRVMAKRPDRKLVVVDIAVPRNIDPHVVCVSGVSLAVVDDLSQMVQDNKNKRLMAVERAEEIIHLKTEEFYRILDRAAVAEMLSASGARNRAGLGASASGGPQ